MKRAVIAKLASVGWLVGTAGCVSLLGDFSADESGEGPADASGIDTGVGPGAEGGADQNVPDVHGDTGPVSDSGTDTGNVPEAGGDAGPLPTLSCNAWKTPQPFRFADLHTQTGGAAAYSGVTAFSAGDHTLRVVAQRSGNPTVFTAYSIDTSVSPPAVTSVDLPSGGATIYVQRIVRLDAGFGVVVSKTNAQGYFDLSMYPFPDAKPVTPLPAPVPLATFPETSSNYLRDVNVLQVGPGAYFFVMLGQQTGFTLEMGLAAGGNAGAPALVDSASQLNQFDGLAMVHANGKVFIYCAGNESTQPAAFYAVPDTAGATSKRTIIPSLGPSTFTPFIGDGVPGSATDTTNLVLQQSDLNDAGQFSDYVFRFAPVANASLPTLASSAIGFGTTYTDFASLPGGNARLFGDELVAIGQGQDANGDPTKWFNFLWMNASGVVRGTRGGVGALLPDRATLISSISAAPGPIARQTAAWNVVWAEYDPQDGGTGYGALYMNELDCQ
jgi:hypothetical protein